MSARLKEPRGPGWSEWPSSPTSPLPRGARRWFWFATTVSTSGILAVSSLDNVDEEDRGLTWHVSISRFTQRGARYVPEHATDDDVAHALDAFRMTGAEEDNHVRVDGRAAVARHFWREVDPSKRTECQCKETEEVVVEPDGYTYTRPRGGA